MYCIKRTTKDTISYYKYDGWESFPKEGPLDLTGVVLLTTEEAALWALEGLDSNVRLQWYGAYKR